MESNGEPNSTPKIYLATSNVNGTKSADDVYMVTFLESKCKDLPEDSVGQTEIALVRASSLDEALKVFIEDNLLRAA